MFCRRTGSSSCARSSSARSGPNLLPDSALALLLLRTMTLDSRVAMTVSPSDDERVLEALDELEKEEIREKVRAAMAKLREEKRDAA
jgi:hypothetical protein